eukprot:6441491-Prymnesium_polylepis.1
MQARVHRQWAAEPQYGSLLSSRLRPFTHLPTLLSDMRSSTFRRTPPRSAYAMERVELAWCPKRPGSLPSLVSSRVRSDAIPGTFLKETFPTTSRLEGRLD